LRFQLFVLALLLPGCGQETASRCPVDNGFVRKSVVSLRSVETRLIRGNAFFVLDKPDGTYPVILTSASAQAALDAAFLKMAQRSIDSGTAVADIKGALVICIPSGDLGLKLDKLSISRIRHLSDAEMETIIAKGIAAQKRRFQRRQLLAAGMGPN
jgi:hypothetical protein